MTMGKHLSEPMSRLSRMGPNTAKHEQEDETTPFSPKIMIKLKNIGSLNVDKVTRVKQRQKRKSQISERQETELRIKAMME